MSSNTTHWEWDSTDLWRSWPCVCSRGKDHSAAERWPQVESEVRFSELEPSEQRQIMDKSKNASEDVSRFSHNEDIPSITATEVERILAQVHDSHHWDHDCYDNLADDVAAILALIEAARAEGHQSMIENERAFLERYPDGVPADIVRRRLEALPPPAADKEGK